MMLGGGQLDGTRLLEPATVSRATTRKELPNGSRALGWDMGRTGMSARAFGHGGFTGTSLWMDPVRDAFVIDLQDVGVRFYTYASTVCRVLDAAKRTELRVVILDRPDPLGGGEPRGPVSEPALASFVNHHPLPTVHGMTLGELATLLNEERGIGARLDVIEVRGWSRGERWADTGLRWVPSSPNLRTPRQVLLYPTLGLLEGTRP